MSYLTDEFEKVRYYDKTLSFAENEKRREIRDRLIKKMSDEEFNIVIQNTGNITAKICYSAIRKNK